jgi:putative component of membrane protein insertase Oxa1/YidC/SpoIIIJ protein YidD
MAITIAFFDRYSFPIFVALISLCSHVDADPWGKDADLCYKTEFYDISSAPCHTSPLKQIGISLIRFHQDVISPCDGPRSHFLPSSSQYTLEAIRKYGFFCGVAKGCDRLMRENNGEWVYKTTIHVNGKKMKLDPVR